MTSTADRPRGQSAQDRPRGQSAQDRRRYLEDGLAELSCDHCGGLVRVRKHSAEQTSVQWTLAAVDGCAEFAMRRDAGQPSALIATCGRLRASIDRALAAGRLALMPPDGTPVEPAPRGARPHGESLLGADAIEESLHEVAR